MTVLVEVTRGYTIGVVPKLSDDVRLRKSPVAVGEEQVQPARITPASPNQVVPAIFVEIARDHSAPATTPILDRESERAIPVAPIKEHVAFVAAHNKIEVPIPVEVAHSGIH